MVDRRNFSTALELVDDQRMKGSKIRKTLKLVHVQYLQPIRAQHTLEYCKSTKISLCIQSKILVKPLLIRVVDISA
jgi:hypothetical protein